MYTPRDILTLRPIRDGFGVITAVYGWRIYPLILGLAVLLTLLPRVLHP